MTTTRPTPRNGATRTTALILLHKLLEQHFTFELTAVPPVGLLVEGAHERENGMVASHALSDANCDMLQPP